MGIGDRTTRRHGQGFAFVLYMYVKLSFGLTRGTGGGKKETINNKHRLDGTLTKNNQSADSTDGSIVSECRLGK